MCHPMRKWIFRHVHPVKIHLPTHLCSFIRAFTFCCAIRKGCRLQTSKAEINLHWLYMLEDTFSHSLTLWCIKVKHKNICFSIYMPRFQAEFNTARCIFYEDFVHYSVLKKGHWQMNERLISKIVYTKLWLREMTDRWVNTWLLRKNSRIEKV